MSDTNQCVHDWQTIESNTLDVGEPSKWCPNCGLILVVPLDPKEGT